MDSSRNFWSISVIFFINSLLLILLIDLQIGPKSFNSRTKRSNVDGWQVFKASARLVIDAQKAALLDANHHHCYANNAMATVMNQTMLCERIARASPDDVVGQLFFIPFCCNRSAGLHCWRLNFVLLHWNSIAERCGSFNLGHFTRTTASRVTDIV
jgi:hypothetical protein